jgi:hypothetical protein
VMWSIDKTLFTLNHGNDFLLVQIYMDGIVFGGSSHVLVSSFQEMMEEFQMSMMGELTFSLGIQVKKTRQGTFVHQAKYTKDLMKKFNMAELKPVSTPMSTATSVDPNENGVAVDQREYRSMIGSLLYLTVTRPHSLHWTVVQRIFRYIKRSLEFGIRYSASSSLDIVGFLDANFVGCGIDRTRTSSTCHFLGSSLVCWSSRKQSSVAQSTIETDYVAAASCHSQILWIVHTMRDFGVIFERVPLMCDNTSVISIAKNPVFHKRKRHLERTHHFLRDHVEKGDIEMRYIDTERKLADIFTKPLDASHFVLCGGGGGNCCLPTLWLGLRGSLCSILYIYILLLFCCIFFIFT